MEGTHSRKLSNDLRKKSKKENKTDVESSQQCLPYDVLRMIFKRLNALDLSNASMVCRSWLEAGNNEKRMRGPTYSLTNKFSGEAVEDLTIKPKLALLFGNGLINSWCNIHREGHIILPSDCDLLIFLVSGIVIDNTEMEQIGLDVLSAYLPEMPGVKISTLVLKNNLDSFGTNNNRLKWEAKYAEEVKKALSVSKGDSNGPKCLLWLCTQESRQLGIELLESLKRCYPGDELSVWGGITSDIHVWSSNGNDKTPRGARCVGIVLSGSVQTWSVIVEYECNSKEKVERRLTSLRNRVRLKKHSMGFMFACFARGKQMFGEPNVESSIFKKLFPEVPLIGCFGAGEFGENTIPNEPDSDHTSWYNEMSTIFMILTYG